MDPDVYAEKVLMADGKEEEVLVHRLWGPLLTNKAGTVVTAQNRNGMQVTNYDTGRGFASTSDRGFATPSKRRRACY